jgi:tetratricopeptide (TPR) repeat protein
VALGRPEEALEVYRQARSRLEKLAARFPDAREYDEQLLACHDGVREVSEALLSTRRRPEAIRLLEQEGDRVAKLGPDHPETLYVLNSLGVAYYRAGKLPEAIRQFELLRDQHLAKLGLDDPQTLSTLRNLAVSYRRAERLPEATRVFEQVDNTLQRAADKGAGEALRSLIVRRLRDCEKFQDAAGCRAMAAVWEKLGGTDADSLYNAACFRAVAARVAGTTDRSERGASEGEAQAGHAMMWLKQSIAAGFNDVAHIKQDGDLDALRGRDDFKKLVADLEAGSARRAEERAEAPFARAIELKPDDPRQGNDNQGRAQSENAFDGGRGKSDGGVVDSITRLVDSDGP